MEELLKQILFKLDHFDQKLDRIEGRLDRLEQRMDSLEQRMDGLEQRMDGLEQRMASLETRQDRLESELQEVKEAVFRLEDSQPKDIYALLENIDKKLEERNFEMHALNKRVFKVEAELERINSRI
jgi:predicted  nucleic acid-binding Zn-ribbon protein